MLELTLADEKTGFAARAGAGLDLRLVRAIALRVQADVGIAGPDDASANDPRFAAGLVLRLGRQARGRDVP